MRNPILIAPLFIGVVFLLRIYSDNPQIGITLKKLGYVILGYVIALLLHAPHVLDSILWRIFR
jgi:hypothetical protein